MKRGLLLIPLLALLLAACGDSAPTSAPGVPDATQTPWIIVVTATPGAPTQTPAPAPTAAPTATALVSSQRLTGITVKLLSKKLFSSLGGTYMDKFNFDLQYTNNLGRNLSAFSGAIVFTSVFDKTIKQYGWDYTDGIGAGQTQIFHGSVDYNPYIDADQQLATLDLKDIGAHFELDEVIYLDGTRTKIQ